MAPEWDLLANIWVEGTLIETNAGGREVVEGFMAQ